MVVKLKCTKAHNKALCWIFTTLRFAKSRELGRSGIKGYPPGGVQ